MFHVIYTKTDSRVCIYACMYVSMYEECGAIYKLDTEAKGSTGFRILKTLI